MELANGYKMKTTFWNDFTIADKFGIEAVKDTYNRAFNEWKKDIVYMTELAIVLNHKIWECYKLRKEELEDIKDEKWKGNGLSDTALLYVCYKKDGKPLHTYATTENDIQEYNYIIRETEEGLRFTITYQTWNDKNQYILVTLLDYADLDEFEKYVDTQCLFDNIMYKHCEEISSELRNYLSNMDYDGLLEQIKLNGWTDVVIN